MVRGTVADDARCADIYIDVVAQISLPWDLRRRRNHVPPRRRPANTEPTNFNPAMTGNNSTSIIYLYILRC